MMTKKILITGSKGRIGKDLSKYLSSDFKILEFNRGDSLSASYFKGLDGLIHLAAKTPKKGKNIDLTDYIKDNVEFTKNILSLASKYDVKTTIVPTSWSWAFKIGDYQYSKLLQEKIVEQYKKQGLRIILFELPEVISQQYEGVLSRIIKKIKNGEETIVASTNMSVITTADLATICKKYLEGRDKEASKFYKNSIKTFNLYEYIKELTENEAKDKIKYLKKGGANIMTPIINEDKTINFPILEIEGKPKKNQNHS